jgi:hypothetical protein
MPLKFPNPSRSYDATRRAVRFWGHDNALETSFFVREDALTGIQPHIRIDETGLLTAFDLNRKLIHRAAIEAYKREKKGSYELTRADFR